MARRYVKVFLNDQEVRTFGGNGSAVRQMYRLYKGMTKEQFLSKHPGLADFCAKDFDLQVAYSGDTRTCDVHVVDRHGNMVRSIFYPHTIEAAERWKREHYPEGFVRTGF